jgi:LacI family transcriptional regulator
VLNGNKSARIAPATQERVRRAAAEMGYRPNRLARGLGKGRTDTIGLLISGLRNPFFVDIMENAEALALEAGYQVLLDAAPSVHGTYQGHGKILGWPVDGVLMWAAHYQNLAMYLGPQAQNLPVVYLGSRRDDQTDWVTFDLYEGGRQVTEHLASRGYRRIAYVSPYAFGEDRHEEPRHQAYKGVCAAAGLKPEFVLLGEEETRAAGKQAGLEIAARPAASRPDAVFCHNDVIAMGVYCGLRRAGLRVPDDVAVVGFDGVDEAQYLEVSLTTVRTPADILCRRALEVLSRRLAGDRETPPRQVIVPTELVVGGSS